MKTNAAFLLTVSLSICMATFLAMPLAAAGKRESTQYFKDFVVFLEVSGANDAQRVAMAQMFSQFSKMSPNNKAFANMQSLMAKELKNFNKKMFPAYKKYMTHQDIKKIIKFYKSPVGKRLQAAQPKIVKETMKVGMQWGQEISKRMMNESQR